MKRDFLPPAAPDRLPPHSIEAEQGVLGCILLSPNDCLPKCIEKLKLGHLVFYDLRHQTLYLTLVDMAGDGVPIDLITLQQRLKNKQQMEGVGGLAYLCTLPDAVPSAANLQYYLDIVLEKYGLRKMVQTCTGIVGRVFDHEGDSKEFVAASMADLIDCTTGNNCKTIDDRTAGLWFDPHQPPPDEPVLIEIAGVPCATPGNLTTSTAQKKSGKTAFLSAIISASISDHGDNLGVRAFNPDRKTVLLFDTEQSAMDHWKVCDSILRRARLTESDIFKSVCLTSLTIRERLAAVHHVIKQEAQRGDGVFIALIDGHGDLVRNVNDPEETADYVAGLHALAIETHCHIFGNLHLNPGSEFKSRGHLGSELERKCQTNLRMEKDGDVFCAWGDANRGAPIPKTIGPCFVWSNEARMHVSVETHLQTKAKNDLDDAAMRISEAFRMADKLALHYAELIAAIQRVPGVKSSSTAERIFRAGKAARYISKNLLHQWQITP